MIDTAELVGHYRLPKEDWLPLMDEARSASLLTKEISPLEVAYLVSEVSPYTLRHLMIVPDTKNPKASPIGSIATLSKQGLGGFLQFNGDVAREFLADPTVYELDIGFNYTEEDSPVRRKLASVSDHLHSHVVGYSEKELANVITWQQVRNHPEWRAGIHDPLFRLSWELFDSGVVPSLESRFPNFKELFVKDNSRKGLTFRFIQGLNGFSHPNLVDILRLMHQIGKEVYGKVAECFCKRDPETGEFLESVNDRYELLPRQERIKRVEDLIEGGGISVDSQRFLRRLATNLQDEGQVIDEAIERFGKRMKRLPTEDETERLVKKTVNTKWLMKGFTYTMIWSSRGGEDWFFGFDPKVFSASGIPPSSRAGTPKVFWRSGELLSEDEQAIAEEFDKSLVERLKVSSYQK